MVATWQPTSRVFVSQRWLRPPSPSSQVMNTAVVPLWYAGLARIFGSSAASQSSPVPIEQSCVSWQRSGVMKARAESPEQHPPRSQPWCRSTSYDHSAVSSQTPFSRATIRISRCRASTAGSDRAAITEGDDAGCIVGPEEKRPAVELAADRGGDVAVEAALLAPAAEPRAPGAGVGPREHRRPHTADEA